MFLDCNCYIRLFSQRLLFLVWLSSLTKASIEKEMEALNLIKFLRSNEYLQLNLFWLTFKRIITCEIIMDF